MQLLTGFALKLSATMHVPSSTKGDALAHPQPSCADRTIVAMMPDQQVSTISPAQVLGPFDDTMQHGLTF